MKKEYRFLIVVLYLIFITSSSAKCQFGYIPEKGLIIEAGYYQRANKKDVANFKALGQFEYSEKLFFRSGFGIQVNNEENNYLVPLFVGYRTGNISLMGGGEFILGYSWCSILEANLELWKGFGLKGGIRIDANKGSELSVGLIKIFRE